VTEVKRVFSFDLTKEGPGPRLERLPDGRALVRAFTDLKRHKICDEERPHFLNEKLPQAGVGLDTFLTKRLWAVGNTRPYGHRGDLTTILEAILNHGGEARASRLGFEALSSADQGKIVQFLKSLQIVPEGSERVFVER
jgi:CxxC motif-containing protein (DUF1111 family)